MYSKVGQSVRLLIKLYLLRRHENYINLHVDLFTLGEWLFGESPKPTPYIYVQDRTVVTVCRNCLGYEYCDNGGLTYGCLGCKGDYLHTRFDEYEMDLIHKITRIDKDYLIYLFCMTVYELWQDNKGGGWIGRAAER